MQLFAVFNKFNMRKLLVFIIAVIMIKVQACTVDVEGKLNLISYFSIRNGDFVRNQADICVSFKGN